MCIRDRFSTLGWPNENAEDYNYFYPTNTLVTGYDIIGFWVSRMIFSGLAYTGKAPFDTVLIHGIVRDSQGRKMSKSLGNMYTLADLDKLGHRPSAVRYVLAGGYYRRPLNFTLSSLEDAKAALNRLSKFDMQLRNASGTDSVPSYEEFCAAFPELGIFQPAWDSLNDDLNTPEALGHVFSAIRKADIPSLSPEEAARLRNAFHFILAAFGIILPEEGQEEAPEEIRTLADQRWQAKQNRDWTEADRLRAEVAALGWVIKDRKDGYDLARK